MYNSRIATNSFLFIFTYSLPTIPAPLLNASLIVPLEKGIFQDITRPVAYKELNFFSDHDMLPIASQPQLSFFILVLGDIFFDLFSLICFNYAQTRIYRFATAHCVLLTMNGIKCESIIYFELWVDILYKLRQ